MILTGTKIKEEVASGGITITDFSESRLNPNSYNLRLANKLLIYDDEILDMRKRNPASEVEIPERGFLLNPGEVYLGATMEQAYTDKYVPMLEGRSSVGRLGLFVHVSAGFGDCGFSGCWTLELSCVQPIWIYPGVEICQIYFEELTGVKTFYDATGKYQGATTVEASKLYKEFEPGY